MRLVRIPGPFDSADFLYEPKIDGFRALACIHDGHRCQLVFSQRSCVQVVAAPVGFCTPTRLSLWPAAFATRGSLVGMTMVKGQRNRQKGKRFTITLLASLLLSASIGVEGPDAQNARQSDQTPQCLSYERTYSCGCGLKIVGLECAEDRSKEHFHSDLHQGAPLLLDLGGRELSLRSHLPVTNSFLYGEGDRWREEYEGENVKVRIQYRPAKSTCPKVNDPDGCEYFDVAADVVITIAEARPRTYKALGACGR